MKSPRNFFATGLAFLFLMFASSCSTESKVKHYSGDGEIKTRPGGVLLGGGGCVVKFKPVKLDQPSKSTYHFKGLPAWNFNLYFVVEDSRFWVDQNWYKNFQKPSNVAWAEAHHVKYANYDELQGNLVVSLKDTNGKIILQFDRPLSKLTWSGGGDGESELYASHNVSFKPTKGMEYVLEISMNPDPMLKDEVGYVLLRGGGHEGISIGFQ